MKLTTIVLVLFVVLMTGSLSTRADSGNPFGFETNTHPLEHAYCKKEHGLFRDHGYKCNSAPRPHPDLHEYRLLFVEKVGLCYVAASTKPGVSHVGFKADGGYVDIGSYHPRDRVLKQQMKTYLEEIGVEKNDENVKQLLRILESYLSQSSIYGPHFRSGATYVALRDAFREMKKEWLGTVQSDVLSEWTRNLKGIIEKGIRSNSGNMFETFNRQISHKYGQSATPDPVEDVNDYWKNRSLIEETKQKIRAKYMEGYEWIPEKGFKGLADVERIKLSLEQSGQEERIWIYFWLVTFDKCLEEIEAKGDRAF